MLRECFPVQVRTILATALGVRMREDCPHCCGCAEPCLDALGSNAELMGGFFGRAGAIFGLVEAQKSNRSFRFHHQLLQADSRVHATGQVRPQDKSSRKSHLLRWPMTLRRVRAERGVAGAFDR